MDRAGRAIVLGTGHYCGGAADLYLGRLAATVARYGEEWPGYWEDLMANGAKVTSGWTDAYTVDFTAGGSRYQPWALTTLPAENGEPGRPVCRPRLEGVLAGGGQVAEIDARTDPAGEPRQVRRRIDPEPRRAGRSFRGKFDDGQAVLAGDRAEPGFRIERV